jgi:hypothetical protein
MSCLRGHFEQTSSIAGIYDNPRHTDLRGMTTEGRPMFTNEELQSQLRGEQGKTFFHQPVTDFIASIEDELKADGLRSTLNRMRRYEDERSMVLLAALASEAVIDKLLAALIPRYVAELRDERDMPFGLKIRLLKALEIVPKHLTEAAGLVRTVRNQFAHKLTVETLDRSEDQGPGPGEAEGRQYRGQDAAVLRAAANQADR